MRTLYSSPVLEYYRCPVDLPEFAAPDPTGLEGFFRFGPEVICFGQAAVRTLPNAGGQLADAAREFSDRGNKIYLPFAVNEIVDNLRYERYVSAEAPRWLEKSWAKQLYYGLRPLFPVFCRRPLQKLYLRNWNKVSFPQFPVDRSVDILLESLLALAMRSAGIEKLPFIWFWPDGQAGCAIMTHDVETTSGRDFSERLMDIDDAFGIKASFQVVPEKRYEVPASYLQSVKARGFEVNVQGLDHQGNLFDERQAFLDRAKKINEYAELFGARGFRSPTLYRNTDWFQDLNFSYDMSVPSVARLEAQRGGCCTTMPYFLPGGMTELPLTTTEDYTLLHILANHSTALWKQQMNAIMEGHGLISFIIHPDYMVSKRAQDLYKELLDELAALRSNRNLWITLPRDVDQWWRERSQMELVPFGNSWRIEGHGSRRARIAYAHLDGDRLTYEVSANPANPAS